MHRRKLLVGCVLPIFVPGCLDAPSASGDGTGTNRTPQSDETNQIQQAYVIHLEPAADDIDEDEELCEFDELTEAAQREIEQAIEEDEYRVEETPELMMRNCHNGYVGYESEHYWLRITIESE